MNKITRTWSLMVSCWRLLLKDKELLLFPLISGICCLLVLASFVLPIYFTKSWEPPKGDDTLQQVIYYGTLFLFYFCNYFVMIFFNCGIVACAIIRMGGGNPTVGDGLRAAASRFPAIAGWAFIAATVGLVLRLIEQRSEKIGRIVAGLLGTAWTLVSYLVVPILVAEDKGPVAAFKESSQLLKKTWGQQLVGNFSFGILSFLLSLPSLGIIALGFFIGNGVGILVCLGIAVLYLIALALVQSALQSIFQAAVYLYARDGRVPEGFQAEYLSGAISER